MLKYTQAFIKSTYTWEYKLIASFLLLSEVILISIVSYTVYTFSLNINSLWILPILFILISEIWVSTLYKVIWNNL